MITQHVAKRARIFGLPASEWPLGDSLILSLPFNLLFLVWL